MALTQQCLIGCVFLALAGTLTPFYNAAGAFAEGDFAKGLQTQGFNASLGQNNPAISYRNTMRIQNIFEMLIVYQRTLLSALLA